MLVPLRPKLAEALCPICDGEGYGIETNHDRDNDNWYSYQFECQWCDEMDLALEYLDELIADKYPEARHMLGHMQAFILLRGLIS